MGGGKRNDLRRVVRERIAQLDESYETIAARCVPPMSTSYISRIATGQMPTPGDEKLDALAVGLKMDAAVLRRAKRTPVTEDGEVARVRHIVDAAAYAAPFMPPEELEALDVSFGLIYRRLADAHRKPLRVVPPGDSDSHDG